jgi:sugar phosphate isomerase/epimerase
MNLPADKLYDQKKAKDAAIRYLSPYIEEAKRVGVCIAVENMVDFGGFRRRYCGGDVWELIDLVDTINDPSVGICLDTGHALLVGSEIRTLINKLGHRIETLHIHDNDGWDDQHLTPYMGILDWDRFIAGMRDIGYTGALSFESSNTFKALDPELMGYVLNLTGATGKMFARRISE